MLDQVIIVGNLTKDPDLRPVGGTYVANLRIATTQRRFDKSTGEWFDAHSTYFSVAAWRGLGQNIAESLRRGDRVVVVGRLRQRSWTPEGADYSRTETEIDAEVVGADLTFAQVKPARINRSAAAVGPDPQGGRAAFFPEEVAELETASLERALAEGEPPVGDWTVPGDPELTGAPA